MQRPKENLIETPLNYVAFAEIVKVQAQHVKEAETGERKPVDENQLFEDPALNRADPVEKEIQKTETRYGGRETRDQGDEKITTIGESRLEVLEKIMSQ